MMQKPMKAGSLVPELVISNDPASPTADAIRGIQAQLQETYLSRGIRSFAVVADGPGRGTTFLAANLAVFCAQLGMNTVLVDANFENPRQASLFGIPPDTPGLSDWLVLTGSARHQGQFGVNIFRNFVLVPAGTRNDADLVLQQANLKSIVVDLVRFYEVVIFDSPPASDFAHAMAIAGGSERTLLIGRRGVTLVKDFEELKLRVEQCQGRVAGLIISDF